MRAKVTTLSHTPGANATGLAVLRQSRFRTLFDTPGTNATGLAGQPAEHYSSALFSTPGADATGLAVAPAAVGGPAFDDGPEELEIPADKLGLTSDFCEESRENLAQVGHRLVQLEEADDPLDIVNDLFRSVHTVKGGARLLKVRKMETLAHHMESVLDRVRKGTCGVSAALIDLLLDGKKLLEDMVDEVASRGPLLTRISPLLAALGGLDTLVFSGGIGDTGGS